jgi:hypothetical protein
MTRTTLDSRFFRGLLLAPSGGMVAMFIAALLEDDPQVLVAGIGSAAMLGVVVSWLIVFPLSQKLDLRKSLLRNELIGATLGAVVIAIFTVVPGDVSYLQRNPQVVLWAVSSGIASAIAGWLLGMSPARARPLGGGAP